MYDYLRKVHFRKVLLTDISQENTYQSTKRGVFLLSSVTIRTLEESLVPRNNA